MRAVFYPFEEIEPDSIIQITGDAAHHLNVVRVRSNESLLLLNGKGMRVEANVVSSQKNLVEIKIMAIQKQDPTHELSLAIANPKKEAFEDILKASVELGVRNIYPLTSEFSQYDYVPNDRIDRIIENALVQSNNAFWPTVHEQVPLKNFLKAHTETIAFFNSKLSSNRPSASPAGPKKTVLIGPEGGFSPAEVALISSYSKIQEIHLPTPILRAPTATATAIGYLLAMSK